MNSKISLLQEKLKDTRGKRVIFLSHCLLNENTRYLGGAFRRAGVDELIDKLQERSIAVVQMKCPEQKAWGGVLKKDMLQGYCIKGTWFNLFRKPYTTYFIWKTKRSFQRQAKEVVAEIKDYVESGYEVVGVVGVKGSPSCGYSESLDLKKSSEFVANLDLNTLSQDYFNEHCYRNCLVKRSGLFFDELQKQLSCSGLKIKLLEHNLLYEMKDIENKVSL
jgi:uncharacterized protein YbbK (DUF523 family)